MKSQGFSLLELSIVLVIIGLIAGGIVAGSAMIRAAELRAVIQEHEQYKIAIHTFRDKYLGMPGDLKNATAFWGEVDSDPATCADTIGAGTETCDGDGDSLVEEANADNVHEASRFWQHLSNAELVSGSYTGVPSSTSGGYGCEIGTNCPASKMSGASSAVRAAGHDVSHTYYTENNPASHFIYGSPSLSSGTTNDRPLGAVLTTQEAWSLDKKIDDGLPVQGKWMTYTKHGAVEAYLQDVNSCATDADASVAVYDLELEGLSCSLKILW